ncbi:MAG: Eco57I restriction-modification methylase domain-containing protein [Terriglobales bacterium]
MPYRFHQLLKNIGKACESSSLTEAEVEKLFQQHDFFLELGYEGIGRDILAQRSRSKRRYDAALLGFGGRIRTVIEFKKPNLDRPLESYSDDLLEKYVRPHSATIGVLTDGVDLALYFKVNGDFAKQFEFRLSEVTESEARKLEDSIRKRRVDLESLPSVLDWLKENRKGTLLISDSESEPAKIFFQVFQLRPESVFGRLVLRLKEILPASIEASGFTRGSYEFWLKTYARELKLQDTPRSWRDFLLLTTAEEIARFSFALETAYTIVSRLILAKAGDDQRFPGVRFLPRLQESYSELSTRNRLSAENHLEVIGRSFQRAGETLFHSIFSQDIFDWWFETKNIENRLLCLAIGEAVLTIVQFDFADLSGDLLGELYQHYFDRDTRQALGEFYTPGEIIEFILDECGYKGQRGNRLLDPSCGSGSFLVAALRRYLARNQNQDKEAQLRDLTEGLRIVGFDINPFAVLMSQVNYAALILPLYAEAVFQNPEFRILRLPVFRTDSLRLEEREIEAEAKKKDALTINLQFEERTLDVSVYLPITESKKRFVQMRIRVPRFADARKQGLVGNLEEYIAALSLVFQAARDPRHSLATLLKNRFAGRAGDLATYLTDVLDGLNATVQTLKGKYNDGRFLKTIEDLVLAVSLKQDMQYDYVVGNPPYVRIQKIPQHVKEYWEGRYEWADGNYDLYIPFLERTMQAAGQEGWLNKGGKLGFITSDRFLNVHYGGKLREELPKKLSIDLLIDFRDTRVFEGALNYPAVLIGQRGEGTSGDLEAARIFSSDTPLPELLKQFKGLRKRVDSETVLRSEAIEVFSYPREQLKAAGWWLMPSEERGVFSRLMSTKAQPLIELTETRSAAFQGYSTSADPIFIFDQVEDCGQTLKLMPRHDPKNCGCGTKPIEIEKEALRPFLFGKDVGRWLIDWKKTWVMFPYDVYKKHETLYDEVSTVEGWNLIPSKDNIDRFNFAKPDSITEIEDRFPKVWKYLTNHEKVLREREHDRFAKGKQEGYGWYGATYPRGLDYYFRPKLMLQLLSRYNSVAYDPDGKFVFQAGGKGGGVYGVVPTEKINHRALQGFLSSKIADFLIKQVSSVYGGRFYSYADQFLKDLPICQPLLEKNSPSAKNVGATATNISDLTAARQKLLRKLASFPESFASDLSKYELDTVKRICDKYPQTENLKIVQAEVRTEETLIGFEVHYGTQAPFGFSDIEHAECLAEGFRQQKRQNIRTKEVLNWHLPAKAAGCKKLLDLVAKARAELSRLTDEISSQENHLNDVVSETYGLTKDERKVIDDFLVRYSSAPSTLASELVLPEDEPDNEGGE